MMVPTKLYRGDSRGNITKPELYRTEGLLTKLINGGNPAYISEVGLAEAIRVHIDTTNSVEIILQSKSSFLSFSSDRSRALHYASDKKSIDIITCADYTEQRYLFTVNISDCKSTITTGVYSLDYECEYQLVRPNALTIDDLIVSSFVRCEFCKDGQQTHRLLLIDVVSYLSQYLHFAKSESAIHKAQKDSEWLILPVDYFSRLNGFSARIQRSNIWKGDHFLLKTDSPHSVSSGGIKGSNVTD